MQHYIENGHTDLGDESECVRLAKRFALVQDEQGISFLRLTPSLQIDSDRLAGTITPEVERLRLEYFGKTKAPFRSLSRSAKWIESLGGNVPRPSEPDLARAGALEVEASQIMEICGSLLHCEYETKCIRRWLAYAKPDSRYVHRVAAPPGSKLALLERASRDLSECTGFSQAGIVAYILTGERPLLPFARITRRHRSHGNRAPAVLESKRAVIELHSRDVTFEQFRQLYLHIREALNIRRAKSLSEEDRVFLEFVRSLGGEHENNGKRGKTKKAFWGKALRQWNRDHGERQYKSWIALYRRYNRLKKRL